MNTENVQSYSKSNPFQAKLKKKYLLSKEGSAKETIHLEISLEGSGLSYKPGDILGVIPLNCMRYVDDVLSVTKFSGEEIVAREDGTTLSLRRLLFSEFDITNLTKAVIKKYNEFAKIDVLDDIMRDREKLNEYLDGRQIIDLLMDYPIDELQPQQLVDSLRKLSGRLYSIASSQKAHPEEVHLAVSVIRYKSHGRERVGLASAYLADRVIEGETISVYVEESKKFGLPEDTDAPVIMVGPGTGIAPFRAFIEERVQGGAKGKNWLFFGDQHRETDFLYQMELETYLENGGLAKLDLAFSRDGPEKVYVQDKMRENAKDLFAWLEEGAHFYVCGDALHMAKDVNKALLEIIEREGEMDASSAKKYLRALQKEKRYQKDVY